MANEKKIFIELGQECRYQKFRYPTEKRTGKKQHASKLMTIRLKNIRELDLREKMKISVFCVTDDREHKLHPNTLLGKGCREGLYQFTPKQDVSKNSKGDYEFEIPYLYILRTKNNEKMSTLRATAKLLPQSFKNSFVDSEQFYKEIKTDSVCLRVVVEFGDTVLSELSERITHHDGGEKVKLNIIKVTQCSFEAANGGDVDLFTEDKIGPNITPGDYEVRVKTCKWESEWKSLSSEDILYKRVINYKVPPYNNQERISEDVEGKIELKCLKNGTSCSVKIIYRPCHADRKRKMLPYSDKPVACKKPRVEFTGKQIYESISDAESASPAETDDVPQPTGSSVAEHKINYIVTDSGSGSSFLVPNGIEKHISHETYLLEVPSDSEIFSFDEGLGSANETILCFKAQDTESTLETGQSFLVNNGGRNFQNESKERNCAQSQIVESEQMDTSVQNANIPSFPEIDKEKYTSMVPSNEHQPKTHSQEVISMEKAIILNSTDLSAIVNSTTTSCLNLNSVDLLQGCKDLVCFFEKKDNPGS
ncbi:hypothetical protein SNE40_010074 [Patella caerulea]|uniref:RHD domain-containing protein n=1 Tax=Patella caerulea TaxID=87958 RepID=A0AAN8PR70_PATCE